MVHIPDDDEETPTQQNKRPASKPGQRPPTAQSKRPPTGQAQRPPTGQTRQPTGEAQRVPTGQQRRPEKKTGPVQKQAQKKRSTQMLSLEPPRRNRGPQLGKGGTRLDSMGGPSTKSQRNKALFGTVGREGSPQLRQQPLPKSGTEGQRPRVRRDSARQGPVDLGASKGEVDSMIVRRKATRRIPKKDGTGFVGEASPLDSMGSGRRPTVQQPKQRHVDPGPQGSDVPPVVNMPVPPSNIHKRDAGPPPQKGNTLAGVSAEDLLGEEGKKLLENMRKREAEQPPAPVEEQQGGMYVEQRPGTPLNPRTQDSSRQQFQSAEYSADATMEEVTPSDELAPQGSFLTGPTKRMEREVLQTPMPAEQPPPDDLGYERPVDFGEASAQAQVTNDEEPVARESIAHDEMEQRAGYLLWLQGVITREEVEDAIIATQDVSIPVQDLLMDSTFTDQVTLYRFLARHESLAPIDLTQIEPSERALAALRPSIARAYRVIPIEKLGELLVVAASFPFDPKRLLELRRLTASKVKMYIATEEEIDVALMKYFPGGQATLRSPKPEGIGEEEPESEGNITGEGEALEQRYDPTLSGEDSGLYAPVEGPADESTRPPSDVGISEVEEGSDTLDEVSGADKNEAIGDTGDLDESTLGRGESGGHDSGGLNLEDDDELSLGGGEDENSDLDTGPEDLDPFAD